jgi:FMN-dependent dehydrogenase
MPAPHFGDYQMEIYEDGLKGRLPRFPVDYASLERAAVKVLPSWVYSYVGYGAGDGGTQRANVEAFSRYGIVPRMLVAPTERETCRCRCLTCNCRARCSCHRLESSACVARTCMAISRRLKPPHGQESRWWRRP